MQKQIDDIKTLFYWGFVILITLFIFMLGYNGIGEQPYNQLWIKRPTQMQKALT